jgi:hypothetical protein
MVIIAIRAVELEYLVKILDLRRRRYIFTDSDSTPNSFQLRLHSPAKNPHSTSAKIYSHSEQWRVVSFSIKYKAIVVSFSLMNSLTATNHRKATRSDVSYTVPVLFLTSHVIPACE